MTRLVIGFLARMLHFGRPIPPLSPVQMARLRKAFDPVFYGAQVGPDLGDRDPLDHFLATGWRSGHDPSAAFAVRDYLASNPDVAAAGINPLIHYLDFGKAEGRAAMPSSRLGLVGATDTARDDQTETDAADLAPAMDVAFYAFVSGLDFATPMDAVRHYLSTGWRLGLDPTPDFSTSAYLRHNSDVDQAGIAPFLHYIRAGRAEGRTGTDQAAEVADLLTATPDLETLEKRWLHGQPDLRPLDPSDGAAQLLAALRAGADRLVIAFTHDDFRTSRGGVQLCVGREAAMAAARGIDYLALIPAIPRPRLAPDPATTLLYAIVGDARIGPLSLDAVLRAATSLRTNRRIDLVVHALLGHAPEHVAQLARAVRAPKLYAWLHDLTFLCPSFALQRNLVASCDGPPPTSTACRICLFGAERLSHLDRLRALARKVPIHAIAPSAVAAETIRDRSDIAFADLTILPHAILTEGAQAPRPPHLRRDDGVTTIAFAGTPSRLKGYAEFRWLLRHHLNRTDLRFVYLGAPTHRDQRLKTRSVHVTADQPDAMIDALREEQVDFVLHWANWPETFSFSTMEAIVAGADVLTHPGTGNVAALVQKTGRGHVLADRDALRAFLAPENLAGVTAERRARRVAYTAQNSDLSFAVMDAPKPARKATARRTQTPAMPRPNRKVAQA